MELKGIMQNKMNVPIAGDGLMPGSYHVHSVFARVTNFLNIQDQLVYVTNNENLLASNAFYYPALEPQEIISLIISREEIIINDISLKRDAMKIYDSEISLERMNFEEYASKLIQIPDQRKSLFPLKSLLFLLNPECEDQFSSSFDRQFMLNAKKSSELLLKGDIDMGIAIIHGTGYGLTPSGDDFIAGLLLGLYFNEARSGKNLRYLREKIFDIAFSRNPLTNSFLLNAKSGKYFKPLKNILLLLCNENQSLINCALEQLFSVGSTSGADFLSGYIFAIKFSIGI